MKISSVSSNRQEGNVFELLHSCGEQDAVWQQAEHRFILQIPYFRDEAFAFPAFVKALNLLQFLGSNDERLKIKLSHEIHAFLEVLRIQSTNVLDRDFNTILPKISRQVQDLTMYGTKVDGLYLHSVMACHLTVWVCSKTLYDRGLSSSDPQVNTMLDCLTDIAVQRLTQAPNSDIMDCDCVKALWKFCRQNTNGDFWLQLSNKFRQNGRPNILFWPVASSVMELLQDNVDTVKSVIQDKLRQTLRTLDQSNDAQTVSNLIVNLAEMHRNSETTSVLVLGLLWEFFVRKLDVDYEKRSFQVAPPSSVEAWKDKVETLVSANGSLLPFPAFFRFVHIQIQRDDGGKTAKFMSRVRNNLLRKIGSLSVLGLERVITLLVVIVHAKGGKTTEKAVSDALVSMFKVDVSKKHYEIFFRGMAACCSLTEGADQSLINGLLERLEHSVALNALHPCVGAFCEMILTRPDAFLSHQSLISPSVTKALCQKSKQTIVLSQYLNVCGQLTEKMRNHLKRTGNVVMLSLEEKTTRTRIEANLHRITSSIFPVIKPLCQVPLSAVEEVITPLPLSKELCAFVMALEDDVGNLTLIKSPATHPSFGVQLALGTIAKSGLVQPYHLEAWIRGVTLLPEQETAVLTSEICTKFTQLRRFQKTVDESCDFALFFGALNNKISLNENNLSEMKRLRETFEGCFHAYRDSVVNHLSRMIQLPFVESQVLRLYRVGGTVIKYCAKLLYNPELQINKIDKLISLLYTNPTLKDAAHNIPSSQRKGIKETLPSVLCGIASLLGPKYNPFLARTVADIVSTYIRRFAIDTTHPLYQVFEIKTTKSYFYQTLDFEVLGALCIKVIKSRVLHANGNLPENGLKLLKFLLSSSQFKSQLGKLVTTEVSFDLLSLLLTSSNMSGLAWAIIRFCATDDKFSSTLESFVGQKLPYHREKTFTIISDISKVNAALVRRLIPQIKVAIDDIELKSNGIGCESLRLRLKELTQSLS